MRVDFFASWLLNIRFIIEGADMMNLEIFVCI